MVLYKGLAIVLNIDLSGKLAFIAGIADDRGFGWAIAKSLAQAGAKIVAGTWAPMSDLFQRQYNAGKFDASRELASGQLLNLEAIFPIDANFFRPEDIPLEVSESKRYRNVKKFSLSEVATQLSEQFGNVDLLVHSLANASEIQQPLLKTSRAGYLSALSASAYSLVGLLQAFAPLMPPSSSALALSYSASQRVIPGYGGGMSSAKAALESDVRTLAWELGRARQIRINAISAGPLKSRAASAIGFIDQMISYSEANAPIEKPLEAREIGQVAAFLLSPLASAITGSTFFVDNGLHVMGVASDSQALTSKSSDEHH